MCCITGGTLFPSLHMEIRQSGKRRSAQRQDLVLLVMLDRPKPTASAIISSLSYDHFHQIVFATFDRTSNVSSNYPKGVLVTTVDEYFHGKQNTNSTN